MLPSPLTSATTMIIINEQKSLLFLPTVFHASISDTQVSAYHATAVVGASGPFFVPNVGVQSALFHSFPVSPEGCNLAVLI